MPRYLWMNMILSLKDAYQCQVKYIVLKIMWKNKTNFVLLNINLEQKFFHAPPNILFEISVIHPLFFKICATTRIRDNFKKGRFTLNSMYYYLLLRFLVARTIMVEDKREWRYIQNLSKKAIQKNSKILLCDVLIFSRKKLVCDNNHCLIESLRQWWILPLVMTHLFQRVHNCLWTHDWIQDLKLLSWSLNVF